MIKFKNNQPDWKLFDMVLGSLTKNMEYGDSNKIRLSVKFPPKKWIHDMAFQKKISVKNNPLDTSEIPPVSKQGDCLKNYCNKN